MSDGIAYGDYYLLGRLGAGGVAEVFLGKRMADGVGGQLLAVKRLLSQFSGETDVVKIFQEEARVGRALRHTNIGEVYDAGLNNKQHFLAMEFIHGKDLQTLHQRARTTTKRLPFTITAFIVAAIADALDYAHGMFVDGKSVVHRDVALRKILLSYDGVPKLIHFGSGDFKSRALEARLGSITGRYGYMSPEQATASPVDRRSDIFSLGTVLYELTTGTPPFRGNSDGATLAKISRATYTPADLLTDVPRPLVAVIEKALQREPDKRYATAALMSRDLRSFISADGHAVNAETLSRTMRELFRDDYERERSRVEQYQRVVPPSTSGSASLSKPVAMADAKLSTSSPLDDGFLDIEDTGIHAHLDLETLEPVRGAEPAAAQPLKHDMAPQSQLTTEDILSMTFEPTPSRGIMMPVASPVSPENKQTNTDEATTGPATIDPALLARSANPWTSDEARTRSFGTMGAIDEGPTVLAPAAGAESGSFQDKTPTRSSTGFDEKTKVFEGLADLVRRTQPSAFGREITKEDPIPQKLADTIRRESLQISSESLQINDVLGALSPLVVATTVTPVQVATEIAISPAKAVTQVAQAMGKSKKPRGKTDEKSFLENSSTEEEFLDDDVFTNAKPVHPEPAALEARIDTAEEPRPVVPSRDRDYEEISGLFSRGDKITLMIAAFLGLLIIATSYVYALNIPLDPDTIINER